MAKNPAPDRGPVQARPGKPDAFKPASAEIIHQRLLDQYTEIARLAGGLAHEIKNPLSTIRLNMELLAEDLGASESPRDRRALNRVQVVQRECQRLQDLLDDFLNFAKVRNLDPQPCDLNEIIRQILDFFKPKAQETKIEVVYYLADGLPTVLLDRKAFHSAIWNLVINAEQAMPEGGQLVARTYPLANSVAIDIIDTGCGMDEKTVSQIFEAFYSTRRGGSGLGLPTARKIIEAHGGTIRVQSEVGRGTQFTIRLPTPARLGAESSDDRAPPIPLPAG